MNNPLMQLLAQLRQSSNPQQLLLNMLEQSSDKNPMMNNMVNLIKENKYDEIEQIGRNIAKEKGIDYDAEFAKFKQMLGL